jgi:Putative adhesin
VKDLQREILSQVAAGKLSAEEGAARLEALETEPGIASASRPAPTSDTRAGVKQVRVVARLGNTEIIGDPNVSYAVAEGPHKARQEGDTMVIEQSPLDDEASFEFSRPPGRIRIPRVDLGGKLTVRMNPALPLAAKTQAGNLRISGVKGAIAAEVQAGNCDIVEFGGPLNLKVTAGNVTAKGRLDSGASTIRCQMGEVRVVLDKTSSVRIRARTTMGEITFENVEAAGGNDLTIGSGAGSLDCDCTMGTIRITVE